MFVSYVVLNSLFLSGLLVKMKQLCAL